MAQGWPFGFASTLSLAWMDSQQASVVARPAALAPLHSCTSTFSQHLGGDHTDMLALLLCIHMHLGRRD
jgi:hypothetical protein